MIAATKTVTRDAGGAIELGPHLGWFTMVDLEARDGIIVFTTEENANAYIRARGEEDKATAVPIRNMSVLCGLLEGLLAINFAEMLVVDPEKSTGSGQATSLRDFVTDLRRSIEQRTKPPGA
jgi:hypothetical protein